MYSQRKTGVVIPAFDAETMIQGVVETMPDYVDHIIVVNDASTDSTPDVLAAMEEPRLCVLHHEQNQGVGAAITTGYREAMQKQCDIIAVMAADGQMDPDDLPGLLDAIIHRGIDYAKGNRFMHSDVFTAMPPVRLAGNIALSVATRVATGNYSTFDSQCGYTAISAEALKKIEYATLWPRYGYPNDMLNRCVMAGLKVEDIPVRPVYHDEHSRMNVNKMFVMFPRLLTSLWFKRQRRGFLKTLSGMKTTIAPKSHGQD